jgi:heptosyltransferase III
MTRICLKRTGALGDVLMTTPVVRAIGQAQGAEAQIFVATRFPEVFERSPWVTACLSPAKLDVTYFDKLYDLDDVYECSPREHVIDAYAKSVFGQPLADRRMELFAGADCDEQVRYLLRMSGDRPYVVIHIKRHPWPSRNFPQNFWLSVISRLLSAYDGFIVQIGDAGDGFLEGHPRLISLLDQAGLHAVTRVIGGAECFIGVDTATLHMAACTEVPIVCAFTCVRHEYRQPLRGDGALFVPVFPAISCYGCHADYPPPVREYTCMRGDAACVREVSADQIVGETLDIVRLRRSPQPS